ncbi:MAG: hypothetical protein ABW092_09160 [Candidatus Thiodiazotropha sp.]
MNIKQASLLLVLIWLTGCAATGRISPQERTASVDASRQKDATGQTHNTAATQTSQVTDSADTIDIKDISELISADQMEILTLSRLLDRLDRVTTLSQDRSKQLIQQMDAEFDRLDPADRFEYALLLTKKSNSNKSLTRAISILDELEEDVKDRITLQILRLHRRYFALKKQYRSERNKTIELNKKIERLKGLEQDLDKSNTRMQESLNPFPGEPQQP